MIAQYSGFYRRVTMTVSMRLILRHCVAQCGSWLFQLYLIGFGCGLHTMTSGFLKSTYLVSHVYYRYSSVVADRV